VTDPPCTPTLSRLASDTVEGPNKQGEASVITEPVWDDTSGLHARGDETRSSGVHATDAELLAHDSVAPGPGPSAGPRPRRGQPEQTRSRLTLTAAHIFNRVPYWEADTNAIAKEAGYSTGTFYRHFKDKREIFIAAYREWVAEEWANIESTIIPGQTPTESIDRAADALIEHHRRWRVFRGNVRALITYDEELRELTQALRREQLEKMSMLRMRMGQQPSRTLENDAVHAMMFERVCDGIADGEFVAIGCSVEVAQREFRALMRTYLLDPWMLG
jgi:AcrR family transcriptional regulator